MLRPILRRLVLSVPVLVIVSALTFVLAALTPGDPGRALLGTQATPAAVQQIDRSLGLERPIYAQYWTWLHHLLEGSLGHSVFNGEAVTSVLNAGLPITLTLLIGATLVAVVIGVPLGVMSARRTGASGRIISVFATLGFALPAFWLGFLAVLLFAQTLSWLPASGWISLSTSPSGWLRSATLPVLVLAVGGIGIIARQTRDGMVDALDSEYVRALRYRGVSEHAIVYKHALRNALPNVVTVVGLFIVGMLLGSTLVESVFALQGFGSLAVSATSQHDLPVLQGVAVYFTAIVVVVFCTTDLIRAWLNPKLRGSTR